MYYKQITPDQSRLANQNLVATCWSHSSASPRAGHSTFQEPCCTWPGPNEGPVHVYDPFSFSTFHMSLCTDGTVLGSLQQGHWFEVYFFIRDERGSHFEEFPFGDLTSYISRVRDGKLDLRKAWRHFRSNSRDSLGGLTFLGRPIFALSYPGVEPWNFRVGFSCMAATLPEHSLMRVHDVE